MSEQVGKKKVPKYIHTYINNNVQPDIYIICMLMFCYKLIYNRSVSNASYNYSQLLGKTNGRKDLIILTILEQLMVH